MEWEQVQFLSGCLTLNTHYDNKNDLIKKFEGSLSKNVKLSNLSWFNLGGNAEYFFKARNKNQLTTFLKEAKILKSKITLLGAGSNTLLEIMASKDLLLNLVKIFLL